MNGHAISRLRGSLTSEGISQGRCECPARLRQALLSGWEHMRTSFQLARQDWITNVGLAVMLGGAYLGVGAAQAEPVTDRILSHYQLATNGSCAILKINFNIRIRYISHFPVKRGDQLNIKVEAIDQQTAAAETISNRESLRPPQNNTAAVQAIIFEVTRAQGNVLSVQFAKPMTFNVAPGQDFQSILIALAEGKADEACAVEDVFRAHAWETVVRPGQKETVVARRKIKPETVVAKRRAADKPTEVLERTAAANRNDNEGSIPASPGADWLTESEAMPRSAGREEADGGFREARAAMRQGDFDRAISILKKTEGAEALELLGVAYHKNKQNQAAKVVYQEYLSRYGDAPGTEGVRQRLAGLETASAAPLALRGSREESAGSSGRDRSYWSVSGSLSEFYIRDDSFRVVRDPTQPINLNDDPEDRRVRRNVLLSSADLFAVWGNSGYKSKFRFSGTEEHAFDGEAVDFVSVAALFYDTTIEDWDFNTRIGRQTRSGDGVLGRFDGLYASWQSTPWLRVSVVAGSPVNSRKDAPYKDENFFYGAAVGFGPVLGGFDASIFAIDQRDSDFIQRQAIGTELRYADATKSAFLTVDYDTFFNELNALIFNGSLTLPDKSIFRAAIDYRRSPYLNIENALQGQTVRTITEFLQDNTLADARKAAVDRTATFKSASVGYTRQMTEKLQLNADFTVLEIDGTIASFGVEASPSGGAEYFYSAQLIGNELLTKDDLWTLGLRFSDLESSSNYALDVSTRYLWDQDWRITPRVLLSYQEGRDQNFEEYSVLPSLLLDYFWTKDLNLELELGTRFSFRYEDQIETRDTEIFVTAGFRYDFNVRNNDLK